MTNIQQKEAFGGDIGNYSTEVYNKNFSELQPSIIDFRSTVFDKTDENLDTAVKNIFDNLKVHVKSDNNKINDFFFVGQSAIKYGGYMKRAMPIKTAEKSQSDIPVIMLSSLFAAKCVQDNFNSMESSNDIKGKNFSIKVDLVTAIPASEYKTERAEHLEKRLKGEHTVTVYFADTSVTVNVIFENVKVTEEGKTAMLYLSKLTGDEKNAAFEKYKDSYEKDLIIDNNLLSLHVDIGNGTTEFTFIKGANPISSDGIRLGIGHAIETAIKVYEQKLNVDIDRQSFNDVLMSSSKKAAFAAECLTKSLQEFRKQLMDAIISNINSLTKGQMDVLFIHGGGSIMLESDLYKTKSITDSAEDSSDDDFYNSLLKLTEGMLAELAYVDEDYAPHLNARGCYELAEILYKG